MDIGEGADGGPVGLAGGVDVKPSNPGGAGAGEDLRQVRREARILEMAVGVGPNEILTVRGHRRWYDVRSMVKGRFISVNLQKWRGPALAIALALGAAGCGTFSQYPAGMEKTTLGPLRTGQ